MPTPAHLTDQQMDAVLAAAHPLPPDRRSAFLEEVALALSRASVIGDGITHRIIMEAQRRHFSPPTFAQDEGGKYDRIVPAPAVADSATANMVSYDRCCVRPRTVAEAPAPRSMHSFTCAKPPPRSP
jgi:hypothetical protein